MILTRRYEPSQSTATSSGVRPVSSAISVVAYPLAFILMVEIVLVILVLIKHEIEYTYGVDRQSVNGLMYLLSPPSMIHYTLIYNGIRYALFSTPPNVIHVFFGSLIGHFYFFCK